MNIYDILIYTLPLVIISGLSCLSALYLNRKHLYNKKIFAIFIAIFTMLLVLYYIYIICESKCIKDILANTSPLVIIIGLFIFYLNMTYIYNDIINVVLIILLVLYSIYISSVFASGYGNKFLVIIMQIVFLLLWIICMILTFMFWKDGNFVDDEELVILFISFAELIYTIFCIYIRLKYENVLDIKWANEIISYIKDIKILDNMPKIQKFLLKILENEWFKGITIGIISGTVSAIIAGLILNKLNKRR